MNLQNSVQPRHAIVIGGSLGGLFTGNLLRHAGWDVSIYERSAKDLDSRGGGIVLQHEVVQAFETLGVDAKYLDLGVQSRYRKTFAPNGELLSKAFAPQMQTSWSLIYGLLRQHFGNDQYHQGVSLTDVVQNDASRQVTARLSDGSERTADLLVGADGNGSTVRHLLWPDNKPVYAGYLAWRGLIPESSMPTLAREGLHGDFAFAGSPGSHILGYLVPGEHGDLRPGHRLYNYVWYRVADHSTLSQIMTDRHGKQRGYSMPEGELDEHWVQHVKTEARAMLPAPFREAVISTGHPFAQAIRDLTVDSMVKGRVILVGDAAFIPRPHTAASTSKAAHNALALAAALQNWPQDIDTALAHWQPEQLMLGRRLYRQGRQAGTYLLFQNDDEMAQRLSQETP